MRPGPLWRAVLAAVLGAGCTGGAHRALVPPEPPPPAVAETTSSTTTVPAPPPTVPTTTTTAAPPTTATPGCPARPPRAQPWADRPTYEVHVTIDAGARRATGSSTVGFTPDRATDRIVLRLWPNGPVPRAAGASMVLGSVSVDGRAVPPATAADPTLVELAHALTAGRRVTIATTWTIAIPSELQERWSVARGAVRLGSFVPLLPWEPGVGWATDPPTRVHGEATTSPVADWDVTIDAGGLDVVATGEQDGAGHWKAATVRDFGLTAGRFRRTEATARAGPGGAAVAVRVVADRAVADEPAAYAAKAVKVLEAHARRFGPYPYPVFTLALTASLRGGVENPMFVMQGPGTIGRTTSHELGHEWFYSLVGNDQGRDPWLDEGLATWAEAGFEGTLASLRQTAIPAEARGHAGEPTRFYDDKQSSYYRGVYVQPTQALASLGAPALVDCAIAAWVDAQAHAIATPETLRAALERTFPNARAVLRPYGL